MNVLCAVSSVPKSEFCSIAFLVMLGLRLCDLPPAGPRVSHTDVETIELLPVKHSNRGWS